MLSYSNLMPAACFKKSVQSHVYLSVASVLLTTFCKLLENEETNFCDFESELLFDIGFKVFHSTGSPLSFKFDY